MGAGKKPVNTTLPKAKLIDITLLCMMVLLAYCWPLMADEPFAPWAKMIPGGEPASKQMTPTKAEVGIPAYPNASIISVVSIEDKKIGKTIRIVHMVSPDTPEAIRTFYQGKLPEMNGWKYDITFEAFHSGEDYTTAVSQLLPYMEITEVSLTAEDLGPVDPGLKPTLKSRIQIAYNPK